MKHIIKLQVVLEVECSEKFADKLKADPIASAVKHCFKNNSRMIESVEILDEELVDEGVMFNRTMNRVKGIVVENEKKKEVGGDFISVL